MKKIILSLSFLVSVLFSNAQMGEKNFIDQPYIEVTGTAEKQIVPDMIYLKIIINEADTKGKISIDALEKKMKQRLSDLGIDVTKNLTVEDVSSRYIKYLFKEKDVANSREYVLLVHDAAMAGKALKALSEENISNISILKIDHSEMAQMRFNLRLEAVKIAKVKAEAMAEALGQKIGKAIYIAENQQNNYRAQSNSNMLFLSNSLEDEESELAFKSVSITSGVSVKFILN